MEDTKQMNSEIACSQLFPGSDRFPINITSFHHGSTVLASHEERPVTLAFQRFTYNAPNLEFLTYLPSSFSVGHKATTMFLHRVLSLAAA